MSSSFNIYDFLKRNRVLPEISEEQSKLLFLPDEEREAMIRAGYTDKEIADTLPSEEQRQFARDQAIRTVGGIPQTLIQSAFDATQGVVDANIEAATQGINIFGQGSPLSDSRIEQQKRGTLLSEKEKEKISTELKKPVQEKVDRSQEILAGLYSSVVGKQNVEMVNRDGNLVAAIKKPEGTGANLTRGIGTFATQFLALNKLLGPSKATSRLGKVADFAVRGEAVAQVAINPYEANLANVLGSYIANLEVSDKEGFLADINNLLYSYREPLQEKTLPVLEKFAYEKGDSALEARSKLLFEGLVLTLGIETIVGSGLLAVRGSKNILKDAQTVLDVPVSGLKPTIEENINPYIIAGQAKANQISKPVLDELKEGFTTILKDISKDENKIKEFMGSLNTAFKLSNKEKKSSLYETIKKRRELEIEEGTVKGYGDLEEVVIKTRIPFTNISYDFVKGRYQKGNGPDGYLVWMLQKGNDYFSPFATAGVPKQLFRQYQVKEAKTAEWLKILEHNDREMKAAMDDVFGYLGKGKKETIKKISDVLTIDRKSPTIITRKGVSPGTYQSVEFKKAVNKLPEPLRVPVTQIRQTQDNLSEAALKYGQIKDEKILKEIQDNFGIYLRTSYEAFENPSFYPRSGAEAKLKRELREYYLENFQNQARDIITGEKWIRNQISQDIKKILNRDGETFKSLYLTVDGYKRTQTIAAEKKLKDETIKEFLGEIKDPFQRAILSGAKIARYVEDIKFFDEAYNSGNGIWLFDPKRIEINSETGKKTKAFIPEGFDEVIPDNFGPLSGMRTNTEILRFLQGLNEGQVFAVRDKGNKVSNIVANFAARYGSFNMLLKYQATIGSVASAFKNFFGSGSMVAKQGVNPFGSDFAEGIALIAHEFARGTDKEKLEMLKFISRYGFLGKTLEPNDIEGALMEVSKIQKGKYSPERILEVLSKYEIEIPTVSYKKGDGWKTGTGTISGSKIFQKGGEWYRAGDESWKIGYFLNQAKYYKKVQEALPLNDPKAQKYIKDPYEQAADAVERSLQNYDRISTFAKQLKSIPGRGSFYSFNSEALRIFVTTFDTLGKERKLAAQMAEDGFDEASRLVRDRAIKRAVGVTATNLLYRPITGTTLAALYAKKGDKEDQPEKTVQAFKALGPEWYKDANLVVLRNEKGEAVAVDLSSWNPEQYPTDFVLPLVVKALSSDPLEYNEIETMSEAVNAMLAKQATPFLGPDLASDIIRPFLSVLNPEMQGYRISSTGRKVPISAVQDSSWTYRHEANAGWAENFVNNIPLLLNNVFVSAFSPRTVTQAIKMFEDKTIAELENEEYSEALALLKLGTGMGGLAANDSFIEKRLGTLISKYKNTKMELISNVSNVIQTKNTRYDYEKKLLTANMDLMVAQRDLAKAFGGAAYLANNYNNSEVTGFPGRSNDGQFNLIMDILDKSGLSELEKLTMYNSVFGNTSFFVPINIDNEQDTTLTKFWETSGQIDEEGINILLDLTLDTYTELSKIPIYTGLSEIEYDKKTFAKELEKIEEAEERSKKFDGGEISKEEPVSNVVDEPSERTNPYTGEPYEAEMERLGFSLGGELFEALIKTATDTKPKEVVKSTEKIDEIIEKIPPPKEPESFVSREKDEEELLEESVLKVAKEPSQENIKQMEKGIKALGGFKELSQKEVNKLSFLDNKTITDSLDKGKKIKPRLHENDGLTNKNIVETRIDIPAYNSTGNHVVAAHDPTGKISRPGKAIGYGSAAHLKSYKDEAGSVVPVIFKTGPREGVLRIAVGEQNKYPMSTIVGQWQPIKNRNAFVNKAKELNKKEEWIQLGFNPRKSTSFFIKKTMQEVTEADEVIQIGGFVLAKNPKIVQGPFGGKGFMLDRDVKLKGKKYKGKEEVLPKGSYIPFAKGGTARNYRKEYDNYHSSDKQKKDRAHRNNANRKLKREGRIVKGDGKDVDHKDGNPRNNSPSNLRTRSKNTNRSFSRRLKARNGGEVNMLLDFLLATEDINLYRDYKQGNLDKEIIAHEGSKRFQELHGRKDVSTIGGITGSGVNKSTVGKTVEMVSDRINKEREYFNKIIPEEKRKTIPESVQNSAISLMFNVGQDAFTNSQAYQNLLKGDIEGYYKEAFDPKIGFTKITGADGTKRIDEGLVNRRKQEEELAKNLWNPPETETKVD